MNFVAIVGTNAKKSYNRQLLQYMQRHFAEQASIDIYEINGIPLFEEGALTAPAAITRLAQAISQADGVIFSTPEYDHSITSSLKSVIEWLSYSVHPLNEKPVMIVGTSLGVQGTARAQIHLRQILDAPGNSAFVLPGNEFLLGWAPHAFNERGDLKDDDTISFLDSCFNNFISYADQFPNKEATEKNIRNSDIHWASTYDVIVIGFGAAGATASRFAADNGAKVLLLDAAPNGHEGGNTRYAGQVVLTGRDKAKTKAYFKQLFGSISIDEAILDTYIEGINEIPEYFQKYLDVSEPTSYNRVHRDPGWQDFAHGLSPEYPEFDGSDTIDLTTVHDGYFDASLWKNLRQHVAERSDQIDVWLSSPATHLIQDPTSKAILGVQVKRNGQTVNIRARNGVVMTLGGFENNPEYIQNFIGVPKLKVMGTLYNKGDGIRMAQEVGASFWHMKSYEGYGFNTGFTFENSAEDRGKFILGAWPELSHGSIFIAADDGSRYLKEDENGRHGHAYEHGSWKNPTVYSHPHLIFDQHQYDLIKAQGELPYKPFFEMTISAPTLQELAGKIDADPDVLTAAVAEFNDFANQGRDYKFNRAAESMTAFDGGPYYAVELATAMLNTQGGARRNEKAEVLNAAGQPIPHLYSAGEFGGINANQYNGGGNLAECLIFGKIAGENAAQAKADVTSSAVNDQVAGDVDLGSDDLSGADTLSKYPIGENQYLGVSSDGIGGQIVVRVTFVDKAIENVEILQQSESEDVGIDAVETLPKEMVKANTYDVDAISGASASSRAIKSAVKNALDKAHSQVKS
ncbi:MAG: NAD(P)H-dependent oxidoreductase [Sporolactobacillus sp.]